MVGLVKQRSNRSSTYSVYRAIPIVLLVAFDQLVCGVLALLGVIALAAQSCVDVGVIPLHCRVLYC